MTWNTNFGNRVLEGAEAKFYLHILQAAVESSQEAVELNDGVVETRLACRSVLPKMN